MAAVVAVLGRYCAILGRGGYRARREVGDGGGDERVGRREVGVLQLERDRLGAGDGLGGGDGRGETAWEAARVGWRGRLGGASAGQSHLVEAHLLIEQTRHVLHDVARRAAREERLELGVAQHRRRRRVVRLADERARAQLCRVLLQLEPHRHLVEALLRVGTKDGLGGVAGGLEHVERERVVRRRVQHHARELRLLGKRRQLPRHRVRRRRRHFALLADDA
eukprot:288994-Prymnesium_polylepis.2